MNVIVCNEYDFYKKMYGFFPILYLYLNACTQIDSLAHVKKTFSVIPYVFTYCKTILNLIGFKVSF